MDTISTADITYRELISSQTNLKILQTYLYELRSKIQFDANNCKLVTTSDELYYHVSVISDFIRTIDKLLAN